MSGADARIEPSLSPLTLTSNPCFPVKPKNLGKSIWNCRIRNQIAFYVLFSWIGGFERIKARPNMKMEWKRGVDLQ